VPVLQFGRIEVVSRYDSIVALGLVVEKPAQDLKAELWGHTKCRKLYGPNPGGNILFVRLHFFPYDAAIQINSWPPTASPPMKPVLRASLKFSRRHEKPKK
jgi:hypothetical protein